MVRIEKGQCRRFLLQLVRGRLFNDLRRRFPGDQWNQVDLLLPPQLCLKHSRQFSQNGIRNDRSGIVLRDPNFEVPRLQTEIGDGGEDLSKEPVFDPGYLNERVRLVRSFDI